MAQSTFVGQKTFDVKTGTESESPTSSKAAQARKKNCVPMLLQRICVPVRPIAAKHTNCSSSVIRHSGESRAVS